MKICILTQPLHANYGGLLQTYALQTVLTRMGHEVVTDRYGFCGKPMSTGKRIFHFGYHLLRRFILQDIRYNPFDFFFISYRHRLVTRQKRIATHTERFVENHIRTIDFFQAKQHPPKAILDQFDALMVGSDQVWRPGYSYVPAYFLDFAEGKAIRRFAYAASFGVDTWEFAPAITARCAALAKQFDTISVREDSGVELCCRYLGVEAIQLPDPTLLLDKEEYLRVVEKEDLGIIWTKKILCYILDQSPETYEVVCQLSSKLGLSPLVMPDGELNKGTTDMSTCVYPSVSKWITGFRDAEFVVTDSFHGAIFAIIFHKPFVVISNPKRGYARFSSLLQMFDLENHLIYSPEELSDKHLLPIDYSRVNQLKKQWQQRSLDFLENIQGYSGK